MSLPTRGVWIEIPNVALRAAVRASLPTRGVWIEMRSPLDVDNMVGSLPTRGVWIEIIVCVVDRDAKESHSPHGECGLKYADYFELQEV